MIDTDKYEGHTVGDMTFSQAGEKLWFLEHPHSHNASDCMTMNKATLDLIQDAPLILEDYKRLCEELDGAYDTIQEYEEVIEPNRLNKIERLERALKSNGKYNAVVSATGNAGGGSIMVNVMFDDGEEYYGILDKVE